MLQYMHAVWAYIVYRYYFRAYNIYTNSLQYYNTERVIGIFGPATSAWRLRAEQGVKADAAAVSLLSI